MLAEESSKDQEADRDHQQQHGRRVLALWICWLALALFLGAAGVICW